MAYASESRFSQIFSEELTCPVCLEELKEPKCLTSCAHNVCRECLEKMVVRKPSGNREILCPTCRRSTPIPDGVRGLPTNTVLVNLLEASPGTKERFEIQKAMAIGKPLVKRIEKKIAELEKISDEMTLDMESKEKLIHEKADQLCEIVRKQEVSMCSKLKEFYKRKQEIVHDQKSNLMKLYSNATSSVKTEDDSLSQSSVDKMLIELATALKQQLEEVTSFNFTFDEKLVFNFNAEAHYVKLESKTSDKLSSDKNKDQLRSNNIIGSPPATTCIQTEPQRSLHEDKQKTEIANSSNLCDFCGLMATFICADCHSRICKQCQHIYEKDHCPATKKDHLFQLITSQTKIEPKEKPWACGRCTFSNPPQNKICAMCATSRFPESGIRKCAHCTYGNTEHAKICVMCGRTLPRDQMESYI